MYEETTGDVNIAGHQQGQNLHSRNHPKLAAGQL